MKFVCMGFIEESKYESLSQADGQRMMEECLAYDDELRLGGHFLGGEALQSARNAVTLRRKNGAVDVTDGPYAETKEMLGGILFLEAQDLNHAIALMSQHPGVTMGPFEIRPADAETNELIAARHSPIEKTTTVDRDHRRTAMKNGSKMSKIIGWVLSVLITLFLIGASATGKFTQWEGKSEMFGKMGWTEDVMYKIGVVEVAIAVLFLIPQTSFVAAILLAAYLGGATATHVRVGDPFYVPIIIGVLVWIALGLRRPEVFRLAFGNERTSPSVRQR